MNKKLLLTLICALICMTTLAQNNGIIGTWKTVDDETGQARSYVEIFEKNGKVFGKIVEIVNSDIVDPVCDMCDPSDDRYQQPIQGLEILRNMKRSGSEYSGGKILDPENGKEYKCKIWIEAGNLKVRGYVGFFYRTQTWLPK